MAAFPAPTTDAPLRRSGARPHPFANEHLLVERALRTGVFKQMKPTVLGVLCVLVLCVIFSLGLWPFHAPRNDVTRLKQSNGIVPGRYGSVLSSREFGGAGGASASVE